MPNPIGQNLVINTHRCTPAVLAAFFCLAVLGYQAAFAAPPQVPASWRIHAASSAVEPTDTVPGSNAIVDLLVNEATSDLWAATGRGVSQLSSSFGKWATYGRAAGLGGEEVPALHILSDAGQLTREVWAATSHTEVFEKQSVPYGDGIFLSLNQGESWIDVSPGERQASGPFQICFDLTSFRGAIVGACFAGGLVMTTDQGQTWKNLFASNLDRIDFEEKKFLRFNNRYFSVVADTAVSESLFVYAGSAEGVNKYVFLDPSLKVTGFDFGLLAQDGTRLYAGTEDGLSLTRDRGTTWKTWHSTDGLPSNQIGAVWANDDTIWVATDDGDAGGGLAVSYDLGDTWAVIEPEQAVGEGRRVRSIISAAGAVWAACENGGLIRSGDQGLTWENVFPDSALAQDFGANDPPRSAANRVNTLLALTSGDTTLLYAGTDSGLVAYTVPMDTLPVRAEILLVGGVDETRLGQSVVRIASQEITSDAGTDSVLWCLTRAGGPTGDRADGYAILDTNGFWRVAGGSATATGVAFFNNEFYLTAGGSLYHGVYPDIDLDSLTKTSAIETMVADGRIGSRMQDVATEITLVDGDEVLKRIWLASDSGLTFWEEAFGTWGVVFSNSDPFEFDLVYRYRYSGRDTLDTEKFVSLSGNFVTALGLQRNGSRSVIWAATQPTGAGQKQGISRTDNGGLTWTVPMTGHRVWNFAFDGDHVWAASSEGLLHSPDGGVTWDTLQYFVDPNSGAFIDSLTEVFAVAVRGDEVWVGTENGMAVLDKNDPATVVKVRRTFQPVGGGDVRGGEGGAYATPVPFSPGLHPNGVRFHYTPPVDGPVTITIYDFINRVVKTVTDGEYRDQGVEYHETDLWDGKNGRGDDVAVGSYFFVIEYANGDVHWGKLAVIP